MIHEIRFECPRCTRGVVRPPPARVGIDWPTVCEACEGSGTLEARHLARLAECSPRQVRRTYEEVPFGICNAQPVRNISYRPRPETAIRILDAVASLGAT